VISAVFGGAVAGAVTIVFALRLVSAGVSRLCTGKGAIWLIALAVVIPLGTFAYQTQYRRRAATADFERAQTNAPTGSTRRGTEDFASFNKWKRSVEQTLKDAEARERPRQEDVAKAQESIDETKAPDRAAQEARGARLDLRIGHGASAASATKEANAANEAKRSDKNRATETKESGPFSDSPTADAREEQSGSTSRLDARTRRVEIQRETDAEVARQNARARHALTYSWVSTDRAGHRWVHIRPLHYSHRE
jgi:hypothetical protein